MVALPLLFNFSLMFLKGNFKHCVNCSCCRYQIKVGLREAQGKLCFPPGLKLMLTSGLTPFTFTQQLGSMTQELLRY